MPSMILKTEVEATPELIIDQLKKFADKMVNDQFPHPPGSLLLLNPIYTQGLQAVEGMPVLVLTAPRGSALGLIAAHKVDGDITMTLIAKEQVESVWNPQ